MRSRCSYVPPAVTITMGMSRVSGRMALHAAKRLETVGGLAHAEARPGKLLANSSRRSALSSTIRMVSRQSGPLDSS